MALNIDDLLAPLPEVLRLGGSGPFVINLTASATPIQLPEGELTAHEHADVYQIQRTEDRRVRYRLRYGPFTTEDEAIAVLEKVRAVYPTALTATADAEDLRAIAAGQAKAQSRRATKKSPTVMVQRPVIQMSPSVAPAAPVVATAPAVPAPPAQQAASKSAATAMPPPVLSLEQMVRRPTQNLQEPLTRTGRGKPPQPPVRVAAVPKTPTSVAAAPAPGAKAAPASAAPPQPQAAVPGLAAGRFDTTQTVRPLTRAELEDAKDWRWFVIELSLSEKPFDPDAVPNLDIYRLYRLYCVAARDGDRVLYALRLGFFSEEVGAKAVANYLAAHYDNPVIKRVSAAERERFSAQRLEARKEVGASGRHAAIEITNERFVR
jgi:SPOR domain